MKKIIAAFSLFVFAITGNSFAQTSGTRVNEGVLNFNAGKMKEGANTLTKTGEGTLQFVKKGNSFSELIFTDEAGNKTKLVATPAGTGGTPNLANKSNLPDNCFGTANKAVGLCVTRSGNIYTVTFMRAGVHRWVATFQ